MQYHETGGGLWISTGSLKSKQSVFADNDAEAARLRETLNAEGVF